MVRKILGYALIGVGLPGVPGAGFILSRGFANTYIAEASMNPVARTGMYAVLVPLAVVSIPFYLPLWGGIMLLND